MKIGENILKGRYASDPYLKEAVRRIRLWNKGKKQGPVKLQLNPTNRCNLKCRYCWRWDFETLSYGDELSSGLYLDIIKEAADLKAKQTTITGGGEPLLKQGILKIMEKVKEEGMEGVLITNGTLLSKKTAEKILEMEWDTVIISIDDPNPEINDYLRGKGSFKWALQGLKRLSRGGNRNRKTHTNIIIHSVLCRKNYLHTPKMISFAKKYRVNGVFFEPVVDLSTRTSMGKLLKMNRIEAVLAAIYLKKAVIQGMNFGVNNNCHLLSRELINTANKMDSIKSAMSCYSPFYNTVIRPNGEVIPCCMADSGFNVSQSSLGDIWLNKFEKIREHLLKKDFPQYCKNCNPSQVVENMAINSQLNADELVRNRY